MEEDEDTIIVEGTAMTTEVDSTVEDQAVVGGRSKDAATVIFAEWSLQMHIHDQEAEFILHNRSVRMAKEVDVIEVGEWTNKPSVI